MKTFKQIILESKEIRKKYQLREAHENHINHDAIIYENYIDQLVYQRFVERVNQKAIQEGWLDKLQSVGDVVSAGLSFVPGLNLVGSAIDAVSAGIDVAQGQYGEAGMRSLSAGAGLIPGGGAAVKGARLLAKGADIGSDIVKGSKVLSSTVGGIGKAAGVVGGLAGKAAGAVGKVGEVATKYGNIGGIGTKATQVAQKLGTTSKIAGGVQDVASGVKQGGGAAGEAISGVLSKVSPGIGSSATSVTDKAKRLSNAVGCVMASYEPTGNFINENCAAGSSTQQGNQQSQQQQDEEEAEDEELEASNRKKEVQTFQYGTDLSSELQSRGIQGSGSFAPISQAELQSYGAPSKSTQTEKIQQTRFNESIERKVRIAVNKYLSSKEGEKLNNHLNNVKKQLAKKLET